MQYDLHSHSLYSDGDLSPEELVIRAQENGVHALALTDHDTVDGVCRARVAAEKVGITLINGVEISTRWEKLDIHVLGLGVDVNNETLLSGLRYHQVERVARAKQVSEKFEKLNIPGMWDEVSQQVNTHYVGRPDFARVLVKRGVVKDFQAAFHKYLGAGKPAYVATEWASIPEAVRWINAAGGLAVLAHPGRYRTTRSKLTRLLADFKKSGGMGMEVLYSRQDMQKTRDLAQLAEQFGLLASAGSDFHGESYPGMSLGALGEMPQNCTPIWEDSCWRKCL